MKREVLFTSFCIVLLAACNNDKNGDLDELNSNRQKWESLNETDYEMTFSFSAFSPDSGTYQIYAQQERVQTALLLASESQDDEYQDSDRPIFEIATIANLFVIAEQAISTEQEYRISYDNELGYPTSIMINQSLAAVDGDSSYTVSDLLRGSNTSCPTVVLPGITVNLTTVGDFAPGVCEAMIVIEDGDFVERLENCANNTFNGAFARTGNYTITASYPGFVAQTIDDVEVYPFICNVGNRSFDIELQALIQ